MYSDPTTARVAAAWLTTDPQVRHIEDWGCGVGGFKDFLPAAIEYVGIDGSESRFSDVVADLEDYRSETDAIFMRNVLEHNPGWAKILDNALASFRRRMVLVMFTPFQAETKIIATYPNFLGSGVDMVDIGFRVEDILARISGDFDVFQIRDIATKSQYGCEHMFFLEGAKDQPWAGHRADKTYSQSGQFSDTLETNLGSPMRWGE